MIQVNTNKKRTGSRKMTSLLATFAFYFYGFSSYVCKQIFFGFACFWAFFNRVVLFLSAACFFTLSIIYVPHIFLCPDMWRNSIFTAMWTVFDCMNIAQLIYFTIDGYSGCSQADNLSYIILKRWSSRNYDTGFSRFLN